MHRVWNSGRQYAMRIPEFTPHETLPTAAPPVRLAALISSATGRSA
ncbi:hypothetical protein [Streptomyces halobius]|uniref:Uncharacterized protein n=1 Tax=Streptomyces halobius TaxID=2879846 RepID=A0ABY4MFE2_9ACTN|nr:hypothetical protein [Streptomyces halobius]UQA96213.1 hypothetical protein K9S39_33910 [Streptomyces halobius]